MITRQYLSLAMLLLLAIACASSSSTRDADDWMVGKKVFHWTDSSRTDPYYGGSRVINVQVWYPIEQGDADSRDTAEFLPGIDLAWTELEGWDSGDYALVRRIRTRSLLNHRISDQAEAYPLVVFSPSLGSHASYYTFYAERLARQGFVVAGITHRNENAFVTDTQGVVYPLTLTYHDSIEQLAIPEDITADGFRELKSVRALVLAEDVIFCVDQLARINQSAFDNRLDLDKVGAWGHSIGGAAVTYASLHDPRILAICNMDGTPPSAALRQGSHVPLLFLEDLTDYRNHPGYRMQYDRRRNYCLLGGADAYRILFGGITHTSFSAFDFHVAGSQAEKAKAELRLQEFLNYLFGFLNHALRDQPIDLVDTITDTLEIEVFIK